jgi:hypothetical protein
VLVKNSLFSYTRDVMRPLELYLSVCLPLSPSELDIVLSESSLSSQDGFVLGTKHSDV